MSDRVEHSTSAAAASGDAEPHGPSTVGLRDAKLGGWYREDSGELFRGMPIGGDDVVVDVGCGAGVNSVFCARHGARVYAIDREPQVIRWASKPAASTPRWSAMRTRCRWTTAAPRG